MSLDQVIKKRTGNSVLFFVENFFSHKFEKIFNISVFKLFFIFLIKYVNLFLDLKQCFLHFAWNFDIQKFQNSWSNTCNCLLFLELDFFVFFTY